MTCRSDSSSAVLVANKGRSAVLDGSDEGDVMAKVSLVVACSHYPYLFDSPDTWAPSCQRRRLSEAVPWDSEEENQAKFERCMSAFAKLREKIAAVKPDVLLGWIPGGFHGSPRDRKANVRYRCGTRVHNC